MGLQMVAGICERLSKDFRYYRSGFPDLIVWNGRDCNCLFAEVKGPGDTLSSKQSIWLDYLISIGAKAEVCRVKCKLKYFKGFYFSFTLSLSTPQQSTG